jgi:hypothetical protein
VRGWGDSVGLDIQSSRTVSSIYPFIAKRRMKAWLEGRKGIIKLIAWRTPRHGEYFIGTGTDFVGDVLSTGKYITFSRALGNYRPSGPRLIVEKISNGFF